MKDSHCRRASDGPTRSHKRHGLNQKERLRQRKDFLAVSKGAERRLATENLLVLFKPNRLPYARLGVTVTKKIGNAVTRNKIKRQIREFFRNNKQSWPQGHDTVVIALKGAEKLDHRRIAEQLSLVFNDRSILYRK